MIAQKVGTTRIKQNKNKNKLGTKTVFKKDIK
jgi:hypothetical protein